MKKRLKVIVEKIKNHKKINHIFNNMCINVGSGILAGLILTMLLNGSLKVHIDLLVYGFLFLFSLMLILMGESGKYDERKRKGKVNND